MTRLLVLLLVLAVIAVVADRLAVRAVEQTVASRLADAGDLTTTPAVHVRGVPFLAQAVRGRYDDVVVRVEGVQAGQLRVHGFVAQLRGVEVPLREAVAGSVREVPVDELTARAVLTYTDMTAAVADRGLRVAPAGAGRARVTGSVQVLGRTLEVTAISTASLEGREVVVTAERFEVGNAVADTVLSAALGNRLDFRLSFGELPYGLVLTDLRAGDDGVVLHARSDGAVLRELTPR
jgi:hypothetical protein